MQIPKGMMLLALAAGVARGASEPPIVGPIRVQYRAGEIDSLCHEALAKLNTAVATIEQLSPEERNSANTFLALEAATADFADAVQPLTFMGYVAGDKDLRQEASQCEEAVAKAQVDLTSRSALYEAIKDQHGGNAAEERLLTETLKTFERNGLSLPPQELQKVVELKQRLSSLEVQFSKNLNEDHTTIVLTAAELAGVPQDYVDSLAKTPEGNFVVTTKESDVGLFLENATDASARKKWVFAYQNRAALANTALLEQAVELRQEIARRLSYPSWADYRIKGRMAKDAATVAEFLSDLRGKLAQRNRADLEQLLQFKKELDPTANAVEVWDLNYLRHQLKKRDYAVDEEAIREYFPADTVIAGMFRVYSELFGVKFKEVLNGETWHNSVKLYQILSKEGGTIAYFYTDFYPREGKYDHAAAFPLILGRDLGGAYSKPVAAIVANLTPPLGQKPSLMSHDDVETIFHEFGHIMHQTLTRAPYASLSGTNVAQDFVEAPSQMLENWVWESSVLRQISGHYLRPEEKLPEALLEKKLAAKDFSQAYLYTRQIFLATLDLKLSMATTPIDVTTLHNQLYQEVVGIAPLSGGHFAASFGHLMGGYDAGYYGYLWSEVYAADMYSRFKAEGLLNPIVGGAYKHWILSQGQMLDGVDLVARFLGRAPNNRAFLAKLHLGEPHSAKP